MAHRKSTWADRVAAYDAEPEPEDLRVAEFYTAGAFESFRGEYKIRVGTIVRSTYKRAKSSSSDGRVFAYYADPEFDVYVDWNSTRTAGVLREVYHLQDGSQISIVVHEVFE